MNEIIYFAHPFFSQPVFHPSAQLAPPKLDHLAPLHHILNPIDDLKLESFLLPFVDSMVAAMGSQVLGTPHSTFSRYTIDVLHQVYQGRDIIERGR
jgi:hypothetical protein